MAQRSFRYALAALSYMRAQVPDQYAALVARTSLADSELAGWKTMADGMFIPYDPQTLLFEQHEGFFELPHIDVDAIPVADFPLYHHWSYDRIYRNDMIKQPDVLMFMFLYSQSFTLEQKRANYDYYEPRCIHESSLSPSVHSILAEELGKEAEAFELFKFATRIDLDDYNRNAREGLHMTAIAGAWMNIVYGFAGYRSDSPLPSLAPRLPAAWKSYSCRILIGGGLVSIGVSATGAEVRLVEGVDVNLELYGENVIIGRKGIVRPIPAAGNAAARGA